ncbi:MAG: ParB/RepB/Spo0J family partition protein [Phycisphaerae bacterium]
MADSTANRPRKPRLGRGLSSLMSSQPAATEQDHQTDQHYAPEPAAQPHTPAETGDGTRQIPVDRISPNPHQPRREFHQAALAELTESIRRQGILQPLIIAPADGDGQFTLIAGERRLRAAREAQLQTVPCIIRTASPQQMLEWALIENIQRTDLNAIERASAYKDYLEKFNLTQADAAQRLGQARTTVANHLRLLELHQDVQTMVAEGRLSFGHARALAALVDAPQRQLALARRIEKDGLSVRETEKLVAAGAEPTAPQTQPKRPAKPAYIRDVEERLTQSVGTKVSVQPGRRKHSGRIVVEYYSLDDFDRISAALGLTDNS